MRKKRFIIGITGASAVLYGIRLLETLQPLTEVETHLVLSRAAGITIRLECPEWELEAVKALADISYKEMDIAATIASGSFPIDAMIVVPASMKTVAQMATGTGETLLHRAADVTLKERRPLYVVPRETPFHLGHLRNLTTLAELGAVIVPPMVAFYHKPSTVDDIVNHTVGKLLDLLKVEHELFPRWQGPTPTS
jgi:polyprenyl P-hydroxybenzoate/phenylacrylic acid decarboxylase-like protein